MKRNKKTNQYKRKKENKNPQVTFHLKTVAPPCLPFKMKARTPYSLLSLLPLLSLQLC